MASLASEPIRPAQTPMPSTAKYVPPRTNTSRNPTPTPPVIMTNPQANHAPSAMVMEEAYLVQQLGGLGLGHPMGMGVTSASGRGRNYTPQQLAQAQQAEIQRQIQLQQSQIQLLQLQQQLSQMSFPTSGNDSTAMMLAYQRQLQAQAQAQQQHSQEEMFAQVHAQRAYLSNAHAQAVQEQQQFDLIQQIRMQQQAQVQAQQAQVQAQAQAQAQVQAQRNVSQGSRSNFAAQVQARTKARQDDRARLDAANSPSLSPAAAPKAVFESSTSHPNPENYGWVSPTSSPRKGTSNGSSPARLDDPTPILSSPVKLGRKSGGTLLGVGGDSDDDEAEAASITSSKVPSPLFPAVTHIADSDLPVVQAKRTPLGLGRPQLNLQRPRVWSTPTTASQNSSALRVTLDTAPRSVSYTPGMTAGVREIKPLRQPVGPPSGPSELGDRNFQSMIRRKAGLNLGVLGRRRDASNTSTPVITSTSTMDN